jgi:hypothetical protein
MARFDLEQNEDYDLVRWVSYRQLNLQLAFIGRLKPQLYRLSPPARTKE